MNRQCPFLILLVLALAVQPSAWGQCRVATLVGEGIDQEDWYGLAIAISGDVALVGAPAHSGSPHESRVFVFNRTSAADWTLVDTLIGPLGFGRPLAVDGATAVFGEFPTRVYEHGPQGWADVGPLVPTTGLIDYGADFGQTLAIQDTRIVAGSPNTTAAYVFERDANAAWVEAAQLTPSAGGWYFGYSVALDGDLVVIGAPNDMTQGSYTGAAFLYQRAAKGGWVEVARLLASDPRSLALFGSSVAISGGSVMVGSPGAGDQRNGQVYVFQRASTGGWEETEILRGDPNWHSTQFGYWMSADQGSVLIGARWDGDAAPYHGAAYVFTESDTGWQRVAKLLPPPEANSDGQFGERVAYSAGTAIISSGLWDSFSGTQSGEAYAYPIGSDSDGDGTMDICDCWLAGDLDLNGTVGLQDLALLLSAFGLDSRGDLTADGVTSLADLAVLLAHFAQPCP